MSLGIPGLDHAIGGGIDSGEMIILGGLPSHGKTLTALQAVRATVERRKSAIYVSLEMTAAQIAKRLIAARTTRESREWFEHTDELRADSALYWRTAGKLTLLEHCWEIGRIEREIGKIASGDPPALIVIDHAQLVRGQGNNRYEQMCDVSARCKALAVEHDCPLILLSQLNREAAKTGVAKSHHLKESGSFEQDADVVIFVRWPWKADPEREQPHRYVFKITKNRNRPIVNWNVEAVINPARQTITRGF